MSDVEADKKPRRKSRRKKKKKLYKMPNELIVIPNADKAGWTESWDKPKNRNMGLFPHPSKILFLSGTGKGKTNTMKNLFLKVQSTRRPFRQLFIICCAKKSKEWLDCQPDGIMTEIPKDSFFDPKVKKLVILDDFEQVKMTAETQRRLSTLFRHAATHLNITIYMSYQTFFDCSKICRKTADVFVLWTAPSKLALTSMADRVGMEPDDIKMIFRDICTGTHDNLCIDRTPGTKYPLRKNIYQPIELANDSDDDD